MPLVNGDDSVFKISIFYGIFEIAPWVLNSGKKLGLFQDLHLGLLRLRPRQKDLNKDGVRGVLP